MKTREEIQAKALEERAKKAKEGGALCCSRCDTPSGVFKISLRKTREGYLCQHCFKEN